MLTSISKDEDGRITGVKLDAESADDLKVLAGLVKQFDPNPLPSPAAVPSPSSAPAPEAPVSQEK